MLSLLAFAVAASPMRSIQEFGVLPTNSPDRNRAALQTAIDWASVRGAALYVESVEQPYPVAGGLILRANVSLVGAQGPVGRGTKHPHLPQPVGSVFAIRDQNKSFLTVETGTKIEGIQFWYPEQTVRDPAKVIAYPPTIQVSQTKNVNCVTLRDITFFGEYEAMNFAANPKFPCEQILFENCFGYSLSGQFIRIDYCYDIPRILHCHVNPANRRAFLGDSGRELIDSVVARKTYAYRIDHTDNAQLVDVFTFGTFGGIWLGPATYGQMTNFNFDCVAVGVRKFGDGNFNRNWMLGQGSIIANAGSNLSEIHPFVVSGQGHLSLSNVEAFSGDNGALTNSESSQDFMLIQGDQRLTVSMTGCRMRNYAADNPITIENPQATVRAIACFDKHENLFEATLGR